MNNKQQTFKYSFFNKLNNSFPYVYEIKNNLYYVISAEECRLCTEKEKMLYEEINSLYDMVSNNVPNIEAKTNLAKKYRELCNCSDVLYNTEHNLTARKNTAELLLSLTEEEQILLEQQRDIFLKIYGLVTIEEMKNNVQG